MPNIVNPPWPLACVVLLMGIALGPTLDAMARRSLASADDVWQRRGLATGVLAGLTGALVIVLAPQANLIPAWCGLALVGTVIVRTDLATHRIPDSLTGASLLMGAGLLLVPWDMAAYGRGWLGALALTSVFLILGLIGPTGLGMGDVKLAPALGLYLAYLGWDELVVGVFSGFVAAAIVGIVVVIRQGRARGSAAQTSMGAALHRALPFGPFLLLGAVIGLAVA
ncbi:MAG: A24 family peptidase [Candidatus Nanopelagicales bacterium]|nr:A24 family peptidase [Candidatus Nanopelagicales bacterium]MDP4906428.1 A24 family peptidase [Candidatus Nanopelagicales bacterium]MDP4975613.1 A24 family peptidase [Candidatus Nanopelagicales bacterium]MDP5094575.1 A24 family peptidase [Candidatus Nanopelagicales bacterium]